MILLAQIKNCPVIIQYNGSKVKVTELSGYLATKTAFTTSNLEYEGQSKTIM